MTESGKSGWAFARRLRRHAYGWRSAPAVKSVKAAVSEIKKVARKEPIRAAEGAVLFLERVSPAIEQVDSSSGAIGTAVRHAVTDLAVLIAKADADAATRDDWLERLWQAFQDDKIPYIENLGACWGDLCVTKERASAWADELLALTRRVLVGKRGGGGFFQGTEACLSALDRAGRYESILELVAGDVLWSYKRWGVRALAALGRKAEAIEYAEACRSPWADDREISRLCEEILLSSGLSEEAYRRYALPAHQAGTWLAWFRAVRKAYPEKEAAQILADLAAHTPGEEGKWFAAAKSAGLLDEALALARRASCDPRTLTRAARDFSDKDPAFAVEAGLLALEGLVRGDGYEITGADVLAAYDHTQAAATRLDRVDATRTRIERILERPGSARDFVARVLGRGVDERP